MDTHKNIDTMKRWIEQHKWSVHVFSDAVILRISRDEGAVGQKIRRIDTVHRNQKNGRIFYFGP
jgi:hypothetical protein